MKIRLTVQEIQGAKKRLIYFSEEEVPQGMTRERALHWMVAKVEEVFPQSRAGSAIELERTV